jgi:protease I
MSIKGKTVVVLVGPEFEDLEFWVPVMRLQEAEVTVIVAGSHAGEGFKGKIGVPAKAEVAFEAVDVSTADAIVIPGGWAPDKLRRYESVKTLVRAFYDSGKIVAMICHAGLVGISAGIVAGHDATGSEGIKDDLVNAGATWKNVPALRSGNLVWGRVVADIPAFCRELVKALDES